MRTDYCAATPADCLWAGREKRRGFRRPNRNISPYFRTYSPHNPRRLPAFPSPVFRDSLRTLTTILPTRFCVHNSGYVRTPCGFWGCAYLTPSYVRTAQFKNRRKYPKLQAHGACHRALRRIAEMIRSRALTSRNCRRHRKPFCSRHTEHACNLADHPAPYRRAPRISRQLLAGPKVNLHSRAIKFLREAALQAATCRTSPANDWPRPTPCRSARVDAPARACPESRSTSAPAEWRAPPAPA